MSPVQGAGVILFRRHAAGPRFLLLQSRKHGTWGFPKGHLQAGEDLAQCAQREVAEETGGLPFTLVPGFHEVVRYRVPPASGGYDKEVHYFLGEAGGGEMHLSEEHQECTWADAATASRLLAHEQTRSLLRAALDWLG